ncbi:hypothetical protein, partial [Streptococcus pseudopneumoniae]|uniref:hypothetical protein n=1 Tax=Streptococcus pseudopneumoniae TaxID=257758 RepID=UPI001EFB20F2
FFLMMVWSLFIIGLMGLFFYNKIGSIIPMVVLPTTEIIEPFLFLKVEYYCIYLLSLSFFTQSQTKNVQ